ncbi:MAG TPA: ABC transporter ATP-binding protein [Acidimicrobiales bacterium]|nr:ABC transporter ATP-binding protein [Acidimicrobiales bacterium]
MSSVRFEEATRRYRGVDAPAVDRLDLTVDDGEFLVLVGPSGCGKSTSLRMLAGLEPVDGGRVLLGGDDVTHLAPRERDIAMVFQSYALYPHMTVAENMGFALKVSRTPKSEIKARVDEAARTLGLTDFLDRKPKELSGGQRQRVAMGRAIVRRPRVFLMDEPLSNLDAQLRAETRAQIASLQRRLSVTTVYVTHDQVEAMTMGDRVAVLRDGVLQQVAPPRELYQRPANSFVARFLGSPPMNLLEATITEGHVSVAGFPVPARPAAAANGHLLAGVRPEALSVVGEGGMAVRVDLVEQLGADAYIHASFHRDDSSVLSSSDVILRVDPVDVPKPGDSIQVAAPADAWHLFDADSGLRL